jgi:Dolichyl-phosphate-mannose-protein mannosyltransferase
MGTPPIRIESRNARDERGRHGTSSCAAAEETHSNLFTNHKYEKILALIFVCTLPLVNPWVRGDGVGYYAFARSLLIEHRLDFRRDWVNANSSFRMGRVDDQDQILPSEITSTGHIDNHFSIGPAILWSPFLLAAHLAVQINHFFAGHISADGFSFPYAFAMAMGTAIYGFLGIFLSFQLAKKYFSARWAFLGVLGVWFASSLPVYMYFNPSWSHAHSAFVVALFFWYWDRTRDDRTWTQWLVLGMISGLMMDVYYISAVLLIVPLLESLSRYWRGIRSRQMQIVGHLFLQNLVFALVLFVVFLPTLIAKRIIYGDSLQFGYHERWSFFSPALLRVCFSSEHGLFTWTPVLLLSVIGLFLLHNRDRALSGYSVLAFVTYLYIIGCYGNWGGISSFGSRFFVSLTSLFVLGLASFFEYLANALQERRGELLAGLLTAFLIVWNMGMIFQWGTHLIPSRGPISWRDAAYNQVAVVPLEATHTLESYLIRRKQLMRHIEEQDVDHLKSGQPAVSEPSQ